MPVFNKMDAVADRPRSPRGCGSCIPTAITTSTMRTDGLAPLKAGCGSWSGRAGCTVRVRVPLADGARLAALYREGEVLSREETATSTNWWCGSSAGRSSGCEEEGVEVVETCATEQRAAAGEQGVAGKTWHGGEQAR